MPPVHRKRAGDPMRGYVDLLRHGAVVACPTETQIGLLADALDPRAVARVSELKRRPAGEPIGVLVPSLEVALRLVRDVSAAAVVLAEQHWPGPLTLVLWAVPGLPEAIVKDKRVAVRVPGPSPALDLVRAFGGPLTATSANRSGEPPCATEDEVRAVFGDALGAIVPGSAAGVASTVVDLTGDEPRVLRQGAITIVP
jgi:L-threonylcarbamoyladenylate synthase